MLVFLLACAHTPATSEAAPTPSATEVAASDDIQPQAEGHMMAHLATLESARNAVIHGNDTAFHEAIAWLADHETHPYIPEEYWPYIQQMKGAARVARDAPSVGGRAIGVATVASICGECHEAMNTGPVFETDPPPPEVEGIGAHMARHKWASDRLWEGMIARDDDRWQAGVDALREEPLDDGDLNLHQNMTEDEATVAKWLHDMAGFGDQMEGSMARSAYYGDLLTRCSSCHATMR